MNRCVRAERRANRLLRLYPKAWRSRYGSEFAELLIAEIDEQPRSWRRDLDVVRGGVVTRLVRLGLCGAVPDPVEQVRMSLIVFGCCTASFLAVGAALWSQLMIGWQWSRPDTTATTVATVLMSVAMLAMLALLLLAAVPVLGRLVLLLTRPGRRALRGPAVLLVVGTVIVFLGARHFGNGWPGTGGHPWADRGLVPGGLAAFSWASTLSVSSYWAHPSALASFPGAELAWMALSPLALICIVVGAVKAVRRLELSRRVLCYETRLAATSCVLMVFFLVACSLWLLDGSTGPGNLFHAGAIDVLGVIVMTVALAVAQQAAQKAHRSRRMLVAG